MHDAKTMLEEMKTEEISPLSIKDFDEVEVEDKTLSEMLE